MRDLLGQHLSLTKGEAVARLQKDWDADVAAFDDIFTEILTMADALTDGIVAQFPERFGGATNEDRAHHDLNEMNERTAELVESLKPVADDVLETNGTGVTADAASGVRTAMRKLWTDRVHLDTPVHRGGGGWHPRRRGGGRAAAAQPGGHRQRHRPPLRSGAGQELTRLLKHHILIAVDLVAAAIKGDKRAFARHDKRWDANADANAAFLADANPSWPEDDVRDLLAQHLSLTKGEAVARQKDWDADVAAFDDIFTEILTMADALTDGIVAQFPERFGAHDATTHGLNGTEHRAAGARRRTRFRSSLGLPL